MGNLLKVHRDRDRLLQLLVFNEEFLVDVVHQTASITSLPFVHTARRSYRLNAQVSHSDFHHVGFRFWWRKVLRTLSFRGRRSRNKVSVGEPAEGSFAQRNVLFHPPRTTQCFLFCHQEKMFSISSMLRSHCNVCDVIYLLRRRMPWLEDRWRTQRTVLNISNCRFPRKKRILNAFCELTSCQFTWLAVTAICSRSNSEVWVVCTCCCRLLHRHVRRIRRASRFRAALWLRVMMFESRDRFLFGFPNDSFARSRPVKGLPAEFKHINKRRTSNYPGFP